MYHNAEQKFYKNDDYAINALTEHPILQQKNDQLKILLHELTSYISESPDGDLYFEFANQFVVENSEPDLFLTKPDNSGQMSYELARMYEYGNAPFEKNYQKAIELYQTAINKNYVPAMISLAMMYKNDIEKNYNNAIELCKLAYSHGDHSAVDYLCDVHMTCIIKNPDATDIKTRRNKMIDYLIDINRPDKIKYICAYNDYMINVLTMYHQLKKENHKLDMEIAKLIAHIQASPDGELYLRAHENWKKYF